MLQLAEIAPNIRTPQFLDQFGATVERMGRARRRPERGGARPASRAGRRSRKDTFNPANVRRVIPNLNDFARRPPSGRLAQISPAVAAKINAPMPAPRQGPTLQGMLGQLPYRGPLAGLPAPASGLMPTPGVDQAQDIGGGARREPAYGPTGSVSRRLADSRSRTERPGRDVPGHRAALDCKT